MREMFPLGEGSNPTPALFAYFLPVSKERCHGLDPEFVLGLNLAGFILKNSGRTLS